MDLTSSLTQIVRSLKNKRFAESGHFKKKCEERNLKKEKIKEIISQRKILGILEQSASDKIYKVWLEYEDNKDLNIVVKLLADQSLKLVTIFPSDSDRRKK